MDEFETLNADPYNSTLFKFGVAASNPVLFVQTYEKKEVIPFYHVQTTKDEVPGSDLAGDEDADDEVGHWLH